MYKVLLADDEASVLDTLLSTIAWQEYGVDEILTAQNGIQALEEMEKHPIDLLVTDIRMPQMDGLELLERVKESYPAVRFVILTAYSDFEYARRALRLGAENYLLKPFQEEELEATLETALGNIYIDQKNTDTVFRDNIVGRWLENNITMEELGERCQLLDINIYLPGYCVVCICWKSPEAHSRMFQDQCVRRLMEMHYEVYPVWDKFGYHTMIVGGRLSSMEEMAEIFSALAKDAGVSLEIKVAVGNFVSKCQDIFLSHKAACKLLETEDFSLGQVRICKPEAELEIDNIWVVEELSTIYQQKEEMRRAGTKSLMKKLLVGRDSKEYAFVYTRLFHSLIQFMDRELPKQLGIQEQMNNFNRLHSFSGTTEEELLSAGWELLEYGYVLYGHCFKELNPVVQKVITYIHKHYAEGVSMKEFCIANNLSPAYIGNLFKRETGMFFNNYLMQYRLCCSVSLLHNTEQKINEIAANVGFSSVNYYISSFKKQLGISPNQYRNKQVNKI